MDEGEAVETATDSEGSKGDSDIASEKRTRYIHISRLVKPVFRKSYDPNPSLDILPSYSAAQSKPYTAFDRHGQYSGLNSSLAENSETVTLMFHPNHC